MAQKLLFGQWKFWETWDIDLNHDWFCWLKYWYWHMQPSVLFVINTYNIFFNFKGIIKILWINPGLLIAYLDQALNSENNEQRLEFQLNGQCAKVHRQIQRKLPEQPCKRYFKGPCQQLLNLLNLKSATVPEYCRPTKHKGKNILFCFCFCLLICLLNSNFDSTIEGIVVVKREIAINLTDTSEAIFAKKKLIKSRDHGI